ncbi:acyltransferase family protein [Poseidonocella sp. HB161398]|uniref:acyltransferase family protein n=1 Tax=Poseidonocella sp. HB161398 TaxID=2320855 RepID=UPI0014874FA6|nr:acyltransferase family protein [Poseidonocella sp. HB161398]
MTRRYELDWLRVLLFALLVPHHVAVGFVDWGADIYQFANDRLAGDGMTLFIYWSHSWRLPSLFLISGVGTWFLTARGSGAGFMGRRLLRLLVPAAFGALAVNALGGYAIARMTGDPGSFPAFWRGWLARPEPRHLQHLWFLANLAIYTLACWPLLAIRNRLARLALPPPVLAAGLAGLAVLAVALAKPHWAAIAGDGYQFGYYLVFFLGGLLIGARHAAVLGWAGRRAWALLAAAVLLFAAKVVLLVLALAADPETGQALAAGGWVPAGRAPAHATAFSAIEALTAWAWCLAALGLAARYLAWPGRALPELSRAVFPVYVLHFPLTLIGLALAAQVAAPWPLEFLLLLAFVYGASWGLWRLADRLGPLRYLIGGRPPRCVRVK